jgi:aspartyl-tRNA(Asn)/glutamyl-tRNA(Gln) amidotransferase subunit A
VEFVDLAKVTLGPAASHAVLAPEAYAYHEEWLKTRAAEYGADVRERLAVGAFVTGAEYLKGQRLRVLLRDEVDAALAKLDVLLAPSAAIEASARRPDRGAHRERDFPRARDPDPASRVPST